MVAPAETPFPERLATLAIADSRYRTRLGSINYAELARNLPTMHYETLRKLMLGERRLTADALEEIATALDVQPDEFAEYRMLKLRDQLDPETAGFDEAARTLREFEEWRSSVKKRTT